MASKDVYSHTTEVKVEDNKGGLLGGIKASACHLSCLEHGRRCAGAAWGRYASYPSPSDTTTPQASARAYLKAHKLSVLQDTLFGKGKEHRSAEEIVKEKVEGPNTPSTCTPSKVGSQRQPSAGLASRRPSVGDKVVASVCNPQGPWASGWVLQPTGMFPSADLTENMLKFLPCRRLSMSGARLRLPL